MRHEPEISVIIPVYDVEPYLEALLESVRGQRLGDFEALMVDDGSPDGCAAICRRFGERDPRFRLIRRANGGLSAARNTGLEQARGRWVTFVDSDDLLHPAFLEELHSAALEQGAAMAMCSFVKFDGTRSPAGRAGMGAQAYPGREAAAMMLYQRSAWAGVHSSAWGKLFDARLWRERRFREGILYEDLDMIPQLTALTARTAATSSQLYFYRKRPGSILASFGPRRLDVLDVCSRLAAAFEGDPLLGPAARDRLLSAAFNMWMLLSRRPAGSGMTEELRRGAMRRCRSLIRGLRREALANPRVRRKNKVASALDYFPGLAAVEPLLRLI